jgi:imidazolonepropionase
MTKNITRVLRNINQLVTLAPALKKDGRKLIPSDLGMINSAAMVFNQNEILWTGSDQDLPADFKNCKTFNAAGYVITPEIVDAHTHLVFGGNRAQEYVQRLNGIDYKDIAKNGGGILKTMNETNKLSEADLFNESVEKIEKIKNLGIGTIEIKSGYGLSLENEERLTRIIHKLKIHFKKEIQIFNTYMAAHAVPPNFSSSKNYIDQVVLPLLEKLASEGIIDFVDIFHEENYFSREDVSSLFNLAKKLNIKRKIHADEFNDNDGAKLACDFGATSADHLLQTSLSGIQSLAQNKIVATLLPGTAFFLGKPQVNARKLLDHGVKVAIASDYNPGSSHFDNLIFLASIAAPTYRMNVAELWSSITLNAAHSLGLTNQGALVPGFSARMSSFKTDYLENITYFWGRNFYQKITFEQFD